MARDYQTLLRPKGVVVPRWAVAAVIGGALLWIAARILVPPSWIVQRLDSPDGRRSAKLLRTQYLRESFVVQLREGSLWHTAYYSAPLTNDYRVDLGERLAWSPDSQRVFLRLQGRPVWGHDFRQRADLGPAQLAAVTNSL